MMSEPGETARLPDAVSTTDFIQAMGQHVSSVCVITTGHGEDRFGLTATAVASVCAQPPRLLVCVNKSGATHDKIVEADCFCVNVLAETQDVVAKAFAGMLGPKFDRFGIAQWTTMRTGAPALIGAAAVLDCVVAERFEQFTHTVFFGEVVSVSSRLGEDALLYGSRKFRQLRKIFLERETGAEETLQF
jgi:flavin reductase (DIM6/NTAB) family NADH-FMN oxidoreductase RutF